MRTPRLSPHVAAEDVRARGDPRREGASEREDDTGDRGDDATRRSECDVRDEPVAENEREARASQASEQAEHGALQDGEQEECSA